MVVVTHMGLLPRQCGALGVATFFVLSGFLITWLLLRENDQSGNVSLRNFYVRRTLRIFPASHVFWAISICAALLRGAHVLWPEAWASFFYMGDYFAALALGAGTSTIMGITWSLGVEEKFYLIRPWVFPKFRNNASSLLRILCGTFLVVWLYRILACLFLNVPRDYLRYAVESRIDNIMVGGASRSCRQVRRSTEANSIRGAVAARSRTGDLSVDRFYAAGGAFVACLSLRLWDDNRLGRDRDHPLATDHGVGQNGLAVVGGVYPTLLRQDLVLAISLAPSRDPHGRLFSGPLSLSPPVDRRIRALDYPGHAVLSARREAVPALETEIRAGEGLSQVAGGHTFCRKPRRTANLQTVRVVMRSSASCRIDLTNRSKSSRLLR
jgi:hypothetical protein